MNQFVCRPDYTKQQKAELIEFLTQLMKCLIGEENDVTVMHSMFVDGKSRSRADIESGDEEPKPPFMIVIDNSHNITMMCRDAGEWK